MKSILLPLVFLLIGSVAVLSQNSMKIEGTVFDKESKKPIPGATIRVISLKKGTYSLSNGTFRLPLPIGKYEIIVSSLGYEFQKFEIDEKSQPLNIFLVPSGVLMGGVEVTGLIDADGVVERAISRKEENMKKITNYSGKTYSKLTVSLNGNVFGKLEDKDKDMILETFSKMYVQFQPEQKSHVDILQRRQTRNIPAEDNIAAIGTFANFYEETVQILNARITTPLAKDAFSYYRFTMKDRLKHEGKTVYVIGVEPSTTTFPAFEGTMKIVEGTYNVIEIDLKPSKSTAISFVNNLQFTQKFEQFPDDIWIPTYLNISGDGQITILKGIAEISGSQTVTSFFTEVHVNEPFPDSLFAPLAIADAIKTQKNAPKVRINSPGRIVVVAADADSSKPEFWEKNSLAVLTYEEKLKYRKVDSLVRIANNESDTTGGIAFNLNPWADFNRVSGFGLILKPEVKYADYTLKTSAEYAFGLKKLFGTILLDVDILDAPKADATLNVGAFSRISTMPDETEYSTFVNTFYALFTRRDFFDYYRADGWFASLSGKYFRFSGDVTATFSRQFSEQTSVNSTPFISGTFRTNPKIVEGNYKQLKAVFQWNRFDRDLNFNSFSNTEIRGKLSLIYGEEAAGNSFRGAEAKFYLAQPTFYTGYAPMNFRLLLQAGLSGASTPIQNQFFLLRTQGLNFGQFLTAPVRKFGGTEYISGYAEHNYSDITWRAVGLPLINGRGLDFILTAGAAKFLQKSNYGYFATNDWFSEAGFGIGRIPMFISDIMMLRFDASWCIVSEAKGLFGWNISISSPF